MECWADTAVRVWSVGQILHLERGMLGKILQLECEVWVGTAVRVWSVG